MKWKEMNLTETFENMSLKELDIVKSALYRIANKKRLKSTQGINLNKSPFEVLSKKIRFKNGKPVWISGKLEGVVAGSLGKKGKRFIYAGMFDGKVANVYAHRLSYYIRTGEVPMLGLTHLDGDGDNNDFDNLSIYVGKQGMGKTIRVPNKLGGRV